MNKNTSGPQASFGQAHVQVVRPSNPQLLDLWRKTLGDHSVTLEQLRGPGLTETEVLLSERQIEGVLFQLWRRTTVKEGKLSTRAAIFSQGNWIYVIEVSLQETSGALRFVFKAGRHREPLLALDLLGPELRNSCLFKSIEGKGSNVVFARFVMAFFSGVDFFFDKSVDWNDRLVVDHLEKTIPGAAIDDFAFDLSDKRNKLQVVPQEENLRRDQERAREIERMELEALELDCVSGVTAQPNSYAALALKYPNIARNPALTIRILAQLVEVLSERRRAASVISPAA